MSFVMVLLYVVEIRNLYVPVCASFTHVAFATYRLEPQYATFGHSTGTAAALALIEADFLQSKVTVQDVNISALQSVLLSQHQILYTKPMPTPGLSVCARELSRCVGVATGGFFPNGTCEGMCQPLATNEWLANNCCQLWKRTGFVLLQNNCVCHAVCLEN